MDIVNRLIEPLILDAIQSFPAVYINGPRQAGKTTLVKKIQHEGLKSGFITFDDAIERAAATRNPLGYLEASGTPLVVDEVQMVPEIFRPLKKLIDERRQHALQEQKSANGCYLLTGSANLLAIPALADAMVGRMATLTLLPLSAAEISGAKSCFIQRCFNKDFSGIERGKMSLFEAMRRASFPELQHMPDKMMSMWLKHYTEKVTLEDPQHLYNLEKAEFMPILLQTLAARAGSLINDASIGRDIGLNAVTTRHYRQLLSNSFITYNLRPWYRNISKRLVKSHKIYFIDTMLLCYLLGVQIEAVARAQPARFGHILENFVVSECLKAIYANGQSVDMSFYRTNDGKEVDIILEQQHKLVAIEIKHAEQISERDLQGIKELKSHAPADFVCGIVLCNVQRVIAFDKDIYLVPFSILWQ